MSAIPHERPSYARIDITPSLARRAAARRDETAALLALTQSIAAHPALSLQALVDTAMALTQSQSAGVSLVDRAEGEETFRWVATTGRFAPLLGSRLPRFFSPCGDVLRTGQQLLMREPALHYPYIAQLGVPIREVLLSPVRRDDALIGTVWVVLHDQVRGFDAEDARILDSLTRFVCDSDELFERLLFGVVQ
jgi:GAF domain-containing protein